MTRRSWPAATAIPGAVLLVVLAASAVTAQSPSAAPAGAADPRGGMAASISGDPVLAAVLVVALGLAASLLTAAWVAATQRRGS